MPLPSKPEFPPLLPPGFYPMTLKDICSRFVDACPLSVTRPKIMAGLTQVVEKLCAAKIAGHLWLDGSFLTEKIDPEDVDLLLRITDEFLNQITQQQLEAFAWYRSRERKATHHCDAYHWIEYPCDHDQYMQGEWWRAYWLHQYGFSRGEAMKGIVVIELPGGTT